MRTQRQITTDSRHVWTVLDTRDNTVKTLDFATILTNGVEFYRIPATDGGWLKITSVKKAPLQPVRCIRVDATDHLFEVNNGILTHNTGGGKSVLQRNVVFHCIMYNNKIQFMGIDLKRVELSAYTEYKGVLCIATTLTDAVEVLTFANNLMMERYAKMEKAGVNNFADLPGCGKALLVMVDEAGQLLDMSGGKGSDEAKAELELKGQAQSILASIARLGRAAGIHLMVAMQRCNANMLGGELKENLGFRAGCGSITTIASNMLFDDNTGTRTPSNPKGRAAIMRIGSKPQYIQVYYTKDANWLKELLHERGLNPDMTPLSTGRSVTTSDETSVSRLQSLELDSNDADVDKMAEERQRAADEHKRAVEMLDSGSDLTIPTLSSGEDNTPKAPQEWDDDMDALTADE